MNSKYSKYLRLSGQESVAIDKLNDFLYHIESISKFKAERYEPGNLFELVNELHTLFIEKFITERCGTVVVYYVDSEKTYDIMQELLLDIYGICCYQMKYSKRSAVKFLCIELCENMEQLLDCYIWR